MKRTYERLSREVIAQRAAKCLRAGPAQTNVLAQRIGVSNDRINLSLKGQPKLFQMAAPMNYRLGGYLWRLKNAGES